MSNEKGEKIFQLLTTISVICSTMIGFTLFGVSIAKVSLIPLELYLILKHCRKSKSTSLKLVGTRKYVFLWFLAILLSSISGLVRDTNIKGYYQTLTFNIIQILFIYLPIFILIINEPNKKNVFEKAAITAATVNAIWAVVQYSFWIIARFDFNNFVFNDLLHGFLGQSVTLYNFETGKLTLRATGLTFDAALMSISLLFGFCFTSKLRWKALFVIAALFSQARSGIICMFFITLLSIVKRIKTGRISKKTMRRILGGVLCICVIILLIPSMGNVKNVLNDSFKMMIYRLGTVFDSENAAKSGTNRHILYLYVPLLVFVFDQPVVWKIFGCGMRTSGVALVNSPNFSHLIPFNSIMTNESWAIECDYAEVILGTGIIGILSLSCMYVSCFWYCNDRKIKNTIICLMLFGFFYGYSCLTIVSMFFIFVLDYKRSEERIESIKVNNAFLWENS